MSSPLRRIGIAFTLASCATRSGSHSMGPGAETQTAAPAATATATPVTGALMFPLQNVRLLDGPFHDAQLRGQAYLLGLDADRLLHTFRANAGLPTSAAPLGGWEAPDMELRGHSLGHYLSACALMYAATGDDRLRQRAVDLVAELRKVQRALAERGAHTGYLSAFPESFFDRLESRQGVWAPYYTLHKIMAGLLDVYRATGDVTALEILQGMANWVAYRASRLDQRAWQALLETEFGGMQEVLTDLFASTRDPEHLRLARLFDHHAVFDPLENGVDTLDGHHANTQIPKAIGAARDCALTGTSRYCSVAESFWKHVALERSYVIGGHSENEHFSPTRHLSRHLGVKTAETCNTYNMLKLTSELFQRDADASRIDFYERGLFNHILASQDPATGGVTYHVALTPGSWRTYSTPTDSFWCCVGTGMENPARYGDAIYAHNGESLFVNLFVASALAWPEHGVELQQQTRFPDEGRTLLRLHLTKPRRFALRVRHPTWAATITTQVNDGPVSTDNAPGGFASLERDWHDGDVVDVRLPMTLRAEALPDDPSLVALLYGPIALAADLGNSGLDHALRYGPQAPELALETTPAAPTFVAASVADVLSHIRPSATPLEFRSDGIGEPQDVQLRPFFRMADSRYALYFPILSEATRDARNAQTKATALARTALDARTVDRVQPGLAADEAQHRMQQKGSDGARFEGRRARSVFWGNGEFSYVLKLPRSGPSALRFECWGGESRRHRFEILSERRGHRDPDAVRRCARRDAPSRALAARAADEGARLDPHRVPSVARRVGRRHFRCARGATRPGDASKLAQGVAEASAESGLSPRPLVLETL
ncbi:MAG: glycoside hydrolase family 127 protein [Polyangiaceae bacterium]